MGIFNKLGLVLFAILFMTGLLFAGKWWGRSVAESEANQEAINVALADTTRKLNIVIDSIRDARVESVISLETLAVREAEAEAELDRWAGEVNFTVETLKTHLEEEGDSIGLFIVGGLQAQLEQQADAIVRLTVVNDSIKGAFRDLTLNLQSEIDLRVEEVEGALHATIADLNGEIDRLQSDLKLSFGKKLFRGARNAVITVAVWEGANAIARAVNSKGGG